MNEKEHTGDTPETREAAERRRAYQSPRLVVIGKLEGLTAAGVSVSAG